jgi:hypothetical protein
MDNEIRRVLTHPLLTEIEDAMAVDAGSYVNREFMDFAIDIVRREISHSGFTMAYLLNELSVCQERLIPFGCRLVAYALTSTPEDEYPDGEVPDVIPNEPPVHRGMGVGFGIKYLIYLCFLDADRQADLLAFLEKERIPYARKFQKVLCDLYQAL